jgi:MFS family permease
MILAGIIAWVLSLTLSVVASNVAMFYIAGIISGVGQALTTTTITGSIIRRWFKKNIGIYTGIVLAANGIGSAVAAQVTSPLINDPVDPFGYRNAYIFVGVSIAIVGVIILVFLREKPENEEPETVATKKKRGIAWKGIEFRSAFKRPYFYIAILNAVMTGFLLQGISGVYAAHMTDRGLDPAFVATVTSVYAVMLTVSKVLVGILYDRLGLRVVMITCQCCAIVCLIAMLLLGPTSIGQVLCFVFAILFALSLPLETLVIPLIVNDLFGSVNYDKFLGLFAALNYLGYSASAPLVNLCYDKTGSYDIIFVPFAILMFVACIVFQFVISAANRERKMQQGQ